MSMFDRWEADDDDDYPLMSFERLEDGKVKHFDIITKKDIIFDDIEKLRKWWDENTEEIYRKYREKDG